MNILVSREFRVVMADAFMDLFRAHSTPGDIPNIYPKLNSFEPGDVWNFFKEQYAQEEYETPSVVSYVWVPEGCDPKQGYDCIVFYSKNAICVATLDYTDLSGHASLLRATMVSHLHGFEFKFEEHVNPACALSVPDIPSPEFKNSLV